VAGEIGFLVKQFSIFGGMPLCPLVPHGHNGTALSLLAPAAQSLTGSNMPFHRVPKPTKNFQTNFRVK
jgi:hypothetical protein